MTHLITDHSILEQISTILFNSDKDEQETARTQAMKLSANEPDIVNVLLNSMIPGRNLLDTIRERALRYHSVRTSSKPNQNLNDSIATTLHAAFTYLNDNPIPQSDCDFEAFKLSLDALLMQ